MPAGRRPAHGWPHTGPASAPHSTPLDETLYATLPANLALVHSPLGTAPPDNVRVSVDGVAYGEVSSVYSAIVVHDLAPGERHITITCGTSTTELPLVLRPGRTTTIRFRVNRYLFVRRLKATAEPEHMSAGTWRTAFSDLHLADIDAADALLETPNIPVSEESGP